MLALSNIPRAEFLIKNSINPVWIRWFTELKSAIDETRIEPYVVYTAGATLTNNDFGKVHLFNTGSANINVYLPSVDSTDLYSWIKIVRLGTGTSKLLIWAADSDMIEYSSSPGRIWCNENKRTAANITLQLMTATKWGIISGTGIWKTA